MRIEQLEAIAGIAVMAVLTLPYIIGRFVKHGEARFDSETGKLIHDE